MSNNHEMSLNKPSFDKIRSGKKTIELRLYDDKRKQIALGDFIVFSSTEDKLDTVKTKVVGLLRYPSFDVMIDDLPLQYFGHSTKDEVRDGVYKIYSREKESIDGVIGIRIVIVD